jgi:hypothetical protein
MKKFAQLVLAVTALPWYSLINQPTQSDIAAAMT